jgi:hypothetical protein
MSRATNKPIKYADATIELYEYGIIVTDDATGNMNGLTPTFLSCFAKLSQEQRDKVVDLAISLDFINRLDD